MMMKSPILRYFEYDHLPEYLQEVSKHFYTLAYYINDSFEGSPEKEVSLRKLLESKDAAVRTAIR